VTITVDLQILKLRYLYQQPDSPSCIR